MTQALDQFFAGGVPAAKFEDKAYGTIIGGEITSEPRMQQQRDYTTGEPVTYPDGNPAMQMAVTVRAYQPTGDDNGERTFYLKGQMRQAVGEALRKTGATRPEKGGKLFIRYDNDEPVQLKNGRPGNPKKIYSAKYEPPAHAASGAFFDDPTASPNQPTTGQAHAAAFTAALATERPGGWLPSTPAPAPARGRQRPAGIDPATWARMTDDQQAQMQAALGINEAAPAAPAYEPPASFGTPTGGGYEPSPSGGGYGGGGDGIPF